MAVEVEFIDDRRFRVGDIAFHCSFKLGGEVFPPAGFLPVLKIREQVERYIRLCAELKPEIIVEIGIRRGGGAALLQTLNQPRLLIAIELEPEPAPALSAFIATHDLESVVKPHYGVNQADRIVMASIMAAELNGRQIDLVVDDASHLLEETRVTFETLFPMLRPGGVYVIEDWNGDHLFAEAMKRELADINRPGHDEMVDALKLAIASKPSPPRGRLVRLPLELVLARAGGGDVIREVTVMDNWIVIRRGDEAVADPASFRLADVAMDYFSNLQPLA